MGSEHIPADKPQFCGVERNPPFDKGLLAEKMVDLATSAINDLSGAAALDYLMYSGYIIHAYLWLRMALVAQAQLDAGSGDGDYARGKLVTCEFYFKRLLPRTSAHRAAVEAGSDCLMSLPAELFAL